MTNLNLFDPFTDCYATRNLDEDFWWEAQHDEELLGIAEQVKDIVKDGDLLANVPMSLLFSFEERIWVHCSPEHSFRIQEVFDGESGRDPAHWTALCLCILSHTAVEIFHGERVYRFQRSLGEKLLMGNNVKKEIGPGNRVYLTERKKYDEVKDTRPTRVRENDPSNGIDGRRIENGDTTGQISLFDLH